MSRSFCREVFLLADVRSHAFRTSRPCAFRYRKRGHFARILIMLLFGIVTVSEGSPNLWRVWGTMWLCWFSCLIVLSGFKSGYHSSHTPCLPPDVVLSLALPSLCAVKAIPWISRSCPPGDDANASDIEAPYQIACLCSLCFLLLKGRVFRLYPYHVAPRHHDGFSGVVTFWLQICEFVVFLC